MSNKRQFEFRSFCLIFASITRPIVFFKNIKQKFKPFYWLFRKTGNFRQNLQPTAPMKWLFFVHFIPKLIYIDFFYCAISFFEQNQTVYSSFFYFFSKNMLVPRETRVLWEMRAKYGSTWLKISIRVFNKALIQIANEKTKGLACMIHAKKHNTHKHAAKFCCRCNHS